MVISDVGSKLNVNAAGTGSLTSDIGGRNRGILTIQNGAIADFHTTEVNIGNDSDASGSRITVTGDGSLLQGGTYNLGRGTSLQVLDGAELATLPGAGIAVGTEALFEIDRSTVMAGNLFLSAPHAEARVLNGGTFTLNGEVRVDNTASLLVMNPGSRLQGFDSMTVNGDVLVGQGATVVGNSLSVGAGGRIIIGNGSMTVNEFEMVDGALISDSLAFAQGDGGGGGVEAARAASFAFAESDGPSLFAAFVAAPTPLGSLIELNGNVTIAAPARLVLHVYAPGDFDQLFVNGNFDFSGTLELLFTDGYAPATGEAFDFVHVSVLFSGFDPSHILLGGLDPSWLFDAEIGIDGSLRVTSLSDGVSSVPLPGGAAPLAVALLGLWWRGHRWHRSGG